MLVTGLCAYYVCIYVRMYVKVS